MKVPHRGTVRSFPSAARARITFPTVARLTLYCSASSAVDGSASPGAHSPSSILRRKSAGKHDGQSRNQLPNASGLRVSSASYACCSLCRPCLFYLIHYGLQGATPSFFESPFVCVNQHLLQVFAFVAGVIACVLARIRI